jgi:hypothetical protein
MSMIYSTINSKGVILFFVLFVGPALNWFFNPARARLPDRDASDSAPAHSLRG